MTKASPDVFFGINNTDSEMAYGLYLIDRGSIELEVNKGYYSLWFEGDGFDRNCPNPDPYSGECFEQGLLQVTVIYLGDEFKIYNGPIQQNVLLDVDFFITPLEEGIQTVKFQIPEQYSSQLLSYNYDDSAFETISSFPQGVAENSVLRYVFNLSSTLQFEGMEVRLRSGSSIRMWLNDVVIYNDPWSRPVNNVTWCRFLIPGSFLVEGRNVLSFRLMGSGNYAIGFDCKARLLRTMFYADRWDKPTMDRDIALFEASKPRPYSFNILIGSKSIDYSYESYTIETLTQFCIVAEQLSSIPPRFQLKISNQVVASFTTSAYSLVTDRSDGSHAYCYNLDEPVIGNSFSWVFLSSSIFKTYSIMGLMHNGHRILYEEESRYPVTTFNRVTARTCVSPYSTETVAVFSLLSTEYQVANDFLGVTLDSYSGELCVDASSSEPVELNIGVFGSLGYRYVPISIIRSTKDCMLNSTNLVHETDRLEDGECGVGYLGLVYQVCENGALHESRSDCVRLPPYPFSYAVSPVYYISEELSLSPNVTNIADFYAVEPSLPSGLTLNATTGVISGSPSGPNGTYPLTVTATNEGGVEETSFTLTLMYYPCDYNGESIPSGNRVYTRDCVGGSGRVYLTCENGVLSSEHLDECSPPLPFSYTLAPVYYVSQEMSLSPNTTYSGISYTVQPALPSGLSLDSTAGVIAGSPSGPNGTYPLTVTATNDGGTAETSFTLTLMYLPCNNNGEFIPSGNRVYTRACVGSSAQVYRICENGVLSAEQLDECSLPPPFSYSVSPFYYISEALSLSPNATFTGITYAVQPALPSGLNLNPSTGVISGTPSGPNGTHSLTITATNEGGDMTTSFTLALLYPPCSHNGASIPSGDRLYTRDCVGSSGRVYLTCENGVLSSEYLNECIKPSSFAYSITSFLAESRELTLTPIFSDANVGVSFTVQPALPSGLNLASTTGVISGSPSSSSGTHLLTITATNEGGDTTTSFTLALSTSLVVPDSDVFLVVYDCPAGYSGSRLHFSKEFNSDLTGSCTFQFADSFLYKTEPLYSLFMPMRVELNHAEVFDEFSIDPALPTSVSFDNTTGVIEGVWSEPGNRTFTVSATNSIDVQTVTLALSFKYPSCKGQNGVEVSYGEERLVKCFGWSVLGSKKQKCVAGEDGVVFEDLPNRCVEMHAGVFGAVLLACVVVIIVVLIVVSLRPKVKVTIGEVYVWRVCSFYTLYSSFCAMAP